MANKTKTLLLADIQIDRDDIFYKELLAFADESQKDVSELRVLDWGCGRGRYVGFLLKQGIDAYGVDIDQNVILQAKDVFEQNDLDFDKRLRVIHQNNQTDFQDGFFDYVFSDQVIEHVMDIEGLAQEISRITRQDGMQIHRWPAKFRIVEPHLFMPFVHWVPKGNLRYFLVLLYVILGREPHWEELNGADFWTRASVYSEYSHQKTYYRSLSIIADLFKKDWKVKYVSDLPFRYNLLRKIMAKLCLNDVLGLNFYSVIMKLKND